MTPGPFGAVRRPAPSGDGEMSARELAARVIRRRLQAVWRELHAACGDRCDSAAIHRLRVATRRAIAALDAFADRLPARGRRWFRRRLRELRRAAGEARDLDVLFDRLASDTPPSPGVTARRRLVAMLARQRPAARRPVVAQLERLVEADWSGRAGRLVGDVAHRGHGPAAPAYCRKRMKAMVRRFFDRAARGGRREADLHRLRIDCKRLRYTLEIFAPVLPPAHRDKCQKTLESLQEGLGRYTDHVSVAERLQRWSTRPVVAEDRRLLEAMRCAEDAAAERARHGFARWWTRSRRRALRKCFRRALRKDSA